ncbi:MAG: AMP-dependent synthetase/ligase [Spirochaetia bacterium]
MAATGNTVPKRLKSTAFQHPDLPGLKYRNEKGEFETISYRQFFHMVKIFGTALVDLGIERKSHVGIISDNRYEWIITDMALLGLGAVDVPRGSDSTAEEIAFILGHADCSTVFAEDGNQAEKIVAHASSLPLLKTIVLFDDDPEARKHGKAAGIDVMTFQELYEKGEKDYEKNPELFDSEMAKGEEGDLATIIYTSGTTGEPKGVMLSHRAFLFQLDRIYDHLKVQPGDLFLSVLPVWHSFERAVEYVVVHLGGCIVYSKPIGKVMLADMEEVKPQWLTSVPRIWEGIRAAVFRNVQKEGGVKEKLFFFFVAVGEIYSTLFNMITGRLPQFRLRTRPLDILVAIVPFIIFLPLKLLGNLLVFKKIKAKLGGRFTAGISGGGALPPYVDSFFQAVGVPLLEGYGLTETAPILAVRKQHHPVTGTVGPLLADIEHKVIDTEGKTVPPGHKGVLWVRSEQIMEGYYKRPETTAEVLKDGWLNTGDIAVFTHTGEFKIIGRAKETIVLMGGENIEPVPIEDKIKQSEYIDQAMVVGQDKKYLAALIIPNQEKLEAHAEEQDIQYFDWEELLNNPQIQNLINTEIQSLVNTKNSFKNFERIFRFALLPKPFEEGREMTKTLKIKRDVVDELYKKEIDKLFA